MDSARLIKAKEYYDRTTAGEDKKTVALELFGRKNIKTIEEMPEYTVISSIGAQLQREELKKDIEAMKRKQLKSYSKLLDKGEELMDEAGTLEEKVIAQRNQRENLTTGVVERAIAWDGADRNQLDSGDVLEGVII